MNAHSERPSKPWRWVRIQAPLWGRASTGLRNVKAATNGTAEPAAPDSVPSFFRPDSPEFLDLEEFFDRVNHDSLMARVAARVSDNESLRYPVQKGRGAIT